MSLPLVFVDLETTGATSTADRITEIGIVEVSDTGVTEWSTLVNPGTRISDFIERLTGISNRMVANAPTFDAVAEEVLARLEGRLFIAHNAGFDYGFLKNEFKRAGHDFRATVLCTVKLSRRLYPMHARHNLDALIERHGLTVSDRHRALGDARLIWQFWQKAKAAHGVEVLDAAVAVLTSGPALPPHINPALIDELPEGHGVYLFYGENNFALHIGRSKTLRKRVLSHLSADRAAAKENSLWHQLRRVEWVETEGELGALLKEAELVKKLQPAHKQQQNRGLCTWLLHANETTDDGTVKPRLAWLRDLPPGNGEPLYGLFKSERNAQQALKAIAREHGLCLVLLGMENAMAGQACLAHQIQQCKGACTGKETPQQHQLRLLTALQKLALKVWPHSGPVGVKEGRQIHLIDHWRYLGTALTDADIEEVLGTATPTFDADMYKLLVKYLDKKTAGLVRLKQVEPEHADASV